MKKDVYFYGIGTVFVTAVSAWLIFSWAQDSVAQASTDIVAPAEMTDAADRLVRVVLASPY